jgi:hypothetical protein
VRFLVDALPPGEHRLELLLRPRLAGEMLAPPTRAWIDSKPGYAGRNEGIQLKVVD